MAVPIASFPAQSKLLYHGSPDCPRTVVLQILTTPNAGFNNVFVSKDRNELDQAQDVGGILSTGVGIADNIGGSDRLVLFDVKSDIFGRANNFGSLTPILVGVQDF